MAKPPPGAPLVLGGPRPEPGAWLALGILGLVVTIMTGVLWGFAGQGPRPVPIVWGIAALLALRLLTAREVRIIPGEVVVTRTLLGRRWIRRWPAAGVTSVRVQCDWMPPRHQYGDGTPEGEARLLLFHVSLRGRPRLTLDQERDVAAMEALARAAALHLGAPAIRRGYVRRADGVPLRRKRRATSPLAP